MRMWHRLRNLPVGSTTRVGGSVSPRVSVGGQWFSGNVSHAFPVQYAIFSSTTITISCESCRLVLRRFFPSIEVGVDDFLRVPLGVCVCALWVVHIACWSVRPWRTGRVGVLSLPTGMLLPQGCSPTHGVACVTAIVVFCRMEESYSYQVHSLLRQRRLGGPLTCSRVCINANQRTCVCSNDTRSQKETPCGRQCCDGKSGCTDERFTQSLTMVIILRVA